MSDQSLGTAKKKDAVAPILIFGYGNPSRGDDALGPMLLERIAEHIPEFRNIELLTDFQLQVEHSLDMIDRELILFIDASVSSLSCPNPDPVPNSAPFQFLQLDCAPIDPDTPGYTTHTLTPTELIQAYRAVHHHEPPPSFLLTIRGEQFELGRALSPRARDNLQQAQRWIESLLDTPSPQQWHQASKERHQQVA